MALVLEGLVQRHQVSRGTSMEANMFGFGKVTCAFCDGRVAPKDVLRARDWKDIAICATCYAKWTGAGRTCVRCGGAVEGTQATSAFLKPHRAFGHADCGGLRLISREPLPS